MKVKSESEVTQSDRYLFDGGYAKATASGTTDNFTFFYQTR